MKALYCLAPLFALVATTASAQSPHAGGYTGPGVSISTVAQAREAGDDVHVRLRGTIRQHVGEDQYVFADETGTIHVDIDDDLWQGQHIGANDTVELEGEIDKDWMSVEVDVDRVRKL